MFQKSLFSQALAYCVLNIQFPRSNTTFEPNHQKSFQHVARVQRHHVIVVLVELINKDSNSKRVLFLIRIEGNQIRAHVESFDWPDSTSAKANLALLPTPTTQTNFNSVQDIPDPTFAHHFNLIILD